MRGSRDLEGGVYGNEYLPPQKNNSLDPRIAVCIKMYNIYINF